MFLWNDIILELYSLARNIGSILGERKLNFIFAILVLAWIWRVKENPSWSSSQ